jgi:uncharacterized protein (DUF4213/DUF364 family)
MGIYERLYDFSLPKAQSVAVERISMGLGYTAVKTSDGGIGVSYTYFEKKTSCTARADDVDFEAKPATLLLERIHRPDPLEKSMAMALINALNYHDALTLPDDSRNDALLRELGIKKGTHISMVGYFGPTIKLLEEKGAIVEVIDENRGIGETALFLKRLANWSEALILTSTSLLNGTMEEILASVGPDVRTVVLGPSTPMIREAFAGLPVDMLAGIAPIHGRDIFRVVCQGLGTPVILKSCHKKYLLL